MRRSVQLTMLAIATVAVAGASAGITIAAGGSKAPSRAIACTTRSGILELAAHGHCARGLTRVSLPLTSAAGSVGLTGLQGPAGANGQQGQTGQSGEKGQQGVPGPTTTIASSGVTQRGLFNVDGYQTAGEFIGSSISFPLELTSAPLWVEVPTSGISPDPTHCSGTAESPSAAPGYLCLYDRFAGNVIATTGTDLQVQDVTGYAGHVSPFGARLSARAKAAGEVYVEGSWAVTAP